jgi:hypothetical protein
MALSNARLNQGLSRFTDPKSASFKAEVDEKTGNFPKDGEELGEFWSKAIVAYTATISPPPALLPTFIAGLAVMQKAMSVALRPAALPDPTGIIFEQVFNIAFQVYGNALGALLIASSPGVYVGFTPPVGAVGTEIKLKVLPLGSSGAPAKEVVDKMVEIISAWFKSGTLLPTPPGPAIPPPIPWS